MLLIHTIKILVIICLYKLLTHLASILVLYFLQPPKKIKKVIKCILATNSYLLVECMK